MQGLCFLEVMMPARCARTLFAALLLAMPVLCVAGEVVVESSAAGGQNSFSLDLYVYDESPTTPCPASTTLNGRQKTCSGQPYLLFVAAIVPYGITFVPAGIYVLDANQQWVHYVGGPLPAYLMFNPTGDPKRIPILEQLNLTGLSGTSLLVGYGLNDQEMLSAGRYWELFVVQ